jgi:hypothetical protein
MSGMTNASGGLAVLVLSASVAHAQFGTGQVEWQISTDDGVSWQGGRVEVGAATQRVRARMVASWTAEAGYAFAGTQFDAVVTGLNAGGNDRVVDPLRPATFDVPSQTIVATRFGNLIKIDDSRDTAAPGAGSRSVFPGQWAEEFAEGRFTRGQPVSIFEYTLLLDGTPGERLLDAVWLPASGGFSCRSIRVYLNAAGAQLRLQGGPTCDRQDLAYLNASLVVVPAPAGAATMLAAAVWGSRRRRDSTANPH